MYFICHFASFYRNTHNSLSKCGCLCFVAEYINNSDILLSVAACSALGEAGRSSALPLPDSSTSDSAVTKKSVVDRLLLKVKTDNVNVKVGKIIKFVMSLFSCVSSIQIHTTQHGCQPC